MSNIAQTLRDLAVEAGVVDAEEIGAEEITVVTDETVTELEEDIQDLAEQSEKAADDIDQLVKFSDAIVATESILLDRVEFLSQESVQESYNQPLQVMTWSGVIDAMEAYQFPQEMIDDIRLGVSFEAEEGDSGKEQAAKDKKKADGMIAKLRRFLANVLKSIKHAARRFIDLFITSNEKNKRSLEVLKSTIAQRSDSLTSTDKIKVKGYKLLTVGGEVDAVAALNMAEAGYNKQVKSVYNAVQKILTAPTFLTDIAKGKKGALELAKQLPTNASVTLSGGREVRFAVTVSGQGEGFSVNTGVAQSEVSVPEEIDVPTFVTLNAIVAGIGKVNSRSDKAVTELNAMHEALDKAEKAIADRPVPTEGVEQIDMSGVSASLNAITKAASTFQPQYAKEVHKTVHAAYNFALLVAGRYTKKGKEDKAAAAE